LAFSYWIDNLGFITEGRLAAVLIIPSLGVPNWSVIYIINTAPSVDDEKLHQMPTNPRNFHAWYPRASKRDQTILVAKVGPEYYFREELIHIEVSEFFQFMNLDALDKSLMSCYCL
jgi:hypothetical protein